MFEEEEIFCSSEVKFHGQPVGVIIAASTELANSAAELVDIKYQGPPSRVPVPTILDVLEKAPDRIIPLPHFSQVAKSVGDLNGTKKIKGRLEIGSQYHYTMEPQTCVCIPIEDGIDVYSATQYIDATQMAIADALKLPNNIVNMVVRRVGGAYGAKITRSIQIAAATALAAHILNRPVRFIMTIEANMTIVGKRYAYVGDYEVDFDKNGKIQRLLNDYIEDSGCSTNEPSESEASRFVYCLFILLFQSTSTPLSSPIIATTTRHSPSTQKAL